MKRLYGTVVPIVTPLTDEDTIDVESLKRLTDHVIDGGMQGLYPCGTTGEMMYLTVQERKLVAEVTVKQAAGRIPVFVQTGAWNLSDTIELSRHAECIGADGIGVVTPVFYRLSPQGLVDFFVSVAQSVSADFPVYLYGIPQCAVNDLDESVCEEVARRCPNVVGVKYSYPDFAKMQRLMLVNDGKFSVLTGPEYLFEALCAAGGDGTVSASAMVLREHYAAVWDALSHKDYELAVALQRRTNILSDVLCAVNNIAAYKVVLKEEGIITTTKMRRPMENLTAEQEQSLLKRLAELEYRKVLL